MPFDRIHPHLTRGFAYVEYEKADDAEKAIKYMDGGQVDGQEISATAVLLPKPRPFGGPPPMRRGPPPNWRRSPIRGRRGGGRSPPRYRSPPRRRTRSRSRSRSPARRRRDSSSDSSR
jgi:RNA-binding protein with serine-rich domain 1